MRLKYTREKLRKPIKVHKKHIT